MGNIIDNVYEFICKSQAIRLPDGDIVRTPIGVFTGEVVNGVELDNLIFDVIHGFGSSSYYGFRFEFYYADNYFIEEKKSIILAWVMFKNFKQIEIKQKILYKGEYIHFIRINNDETLTVETYPPKEKPSTVPLDWGDLVSKVFDKIAGVASIIALLDAVERRWRERGTIADAHPHQVASQSSETDIVAIRLRMTHGPDHQFEQWLTDPDKLKHYIDVFNQPSSTVLPLKVVFVQGNGKELSVDVLKGTQNNPQLDELLSYLNIDSTEK